MFSMAAVVTDAAAVFGGCMLAVWLRFDSHLLVVDHQPAENFRLHYLLAALLAALILALVYHGQRLYARPQTGSFIDKVPRLVKSSSVGVLLAAVLGFVALQNVVDLSRLVVVIALPLVTVLVLVVRYAMFRIEWNVARHTREKQSVLILGTDAVAQHLRETLKREPMLRLEVTGFMRTRLADAAPGLRADEIVGGLDDLGSYIKAHAVDQIILTDSTIGHDRTVDLLLLCERNLITFRLVPDLFSIITSTMDVQSLSDIPLLGVSAWPLDRFRSRVLKRLEDIGGALAGLVIFAPAMLIAAILIRRDSKGPIFYRQQRCGEGGRSFTLYKLRTMREHAEEESGPVWTTEDDGRRTRVGEFLRRHNLDEVPQFWNVMRGDMGLVGPRPERPHFVEIFKEDIQRYMWRHVSKPGMTGWAQVNGLRGDTSLQERIRYDLYYLENWSLSFDFKILLKTLHAKENAY